MSTPDQATSATAQRKARVPPTLESNPHVKIADLVARNNNSSFVGKIIELEVITKGVNKTNKPRRFLKGLAGDETGVIRFDLAERDENSFQLNDIVLFDKAMNKVSKEAHHYIDVKRFGSYEVLASHADIAVNKSVNMSDAVIPALEGVEVRPTKPRQPRSNNATSSNSNNNNNQSNSRGNKQQNNNNNKPRNNNTNNNNNHNNNQSNSRGNKQQNNNNNKPRNNNTNNNNNTNQKKVAPAPRHPTFVKPTTISSLAPGSKEQVIVGQVISVNITSKTIREREQHFAKGLLADQTGSINFDVQVRAPIAQNDVLLLSNVMNKVDDNGFHYVTIGRYGFYTVLATGSLNTNDSDNKSQIEYVKQQSA